MSGLRCQEEAHQIWQLPAVQLQECRRYADLTCTAVLLRQGQSRMSLVQAMRDLW